MNANVAIPTTDVIVLDVVDDDDQYCEGDCDLGECRCRHGYDPDAYHDAQIDRDLDI